MGGLGRWVVGGLFDSPRLADRLLPVHVDHVAGALERRAGITVGAFVGLALLGGREGKRVMIEMIDVDVSLHLGPGTASFEHFAVGANHLAIRLGGVGLGKGMQDKCSESCGEDGFHGVTR
jgi:hypothetical protein